MMQFKQRQLGLTMVELLVSLTISSFLVLGITQVYLDNKRNSMFQQSQAGNQDSTRFAELTLNHLLGKAGYRRAPNQNMYLAFPDENVLSSHCSSFHKGEVVTGLKNSNTDVGFCLRYQPAIDGELICDGSTATLAKPNSFEHPALNETIYVAVKFEPHAEVEKGTLSCISNKGTEWVELIEGVADMRIQYGLGDHVDEQAADLEAYYKLRAVKPYVNAKQWTNGEGVILTVRYALLLASRPNQRDSQESKVYKDWFGKVPTNDQRRIYQQASSTKPLRNMLP